jgi:hypothetical protein
MKSPRGFQPVNHVLFDIKHSVLSALRENQFAGRETEDCNAHLNNFLEACSNINDTRVSESDKRLRLFVYSLSGRAKDWLNALPSGVIATWDDLKKSFLHRFYPTVKYLEKKERDS